MLAGLSTLQFHSAQTSSPTRFAMNVWNASIGKSLMMQANAPTSNSGMLSIMPY
mgnify:CR=1 FL=1